MAQRGNPNWIKNKIEQKIETEYAQEEISTAVADVTPAVQEAEAPEPVTNSNGPLVLVSENDAYIHERMKSQSKTLEEINAKVIHDHDNKGHILSLPREMEVYGNDYSFRWINKKKRSIDHALDVIGWTFVNRSFFKNLPKHLFTANGSIERGDAILAFMPRKRAEEIRLRPAQISRERVRNTPVQDLNRWENRGEKYYKPDLGAAENDNEKPRGIVVTPDNDIRETET